jgi:hypothetical protein
MFQVGRQMEEQSVLVSDGKVAVDGDDDSDRRLHGSKGYYTDT